MYLFQDYFFDFESGNRGNSRDIIFYEYSPLKLEKQKDLFLRKTSLDLDEILKSYPKEWDLLIGETSIDMVPDEEISDFSNLGVNCCMLRDGSWVNPDTNRWENSKKYYLKNFNDFKDEFQKKILYYMPSVKKEIERLKLANGNSKSIRNKELYNNL